MFHVAVSLLLLACNTVFDSSCSTRTLLQPPPPPATASCHPATPLKRPPRPLPAPPPAPSSPESQVPEQKRAQMMALIKSRQSERMAALEAEHQQALQQLRSSLSALACPPFPAAAPAAAAPRAFHSTWHDAFTSCPPASAGFPAASASAPLVRCDSGDSASAAFAGRSNNGASAPAAAAAAVDRERMALYHQLKSGQAQGGVASMAAMGGLDVEDMFHGMSCFIGGMVLDCGLAAGSTIGGSAAPGAPAMLTMGQC